ncbi:hypothetical protein [Streptomyces lydicus]|uniref:hypothetical protein n=1 Tax=Streptomyces lydicus TaxID=47763 RepID=UPI0037AA89C2
MVIAACTEIPLVSRAAARVLPLVDSTEALVDAALSRLSGPEPEDFVPGDETVAYPRPQVRTSQAVRVLTCGDDQAHVGPPRQRLEPGARGLWPHTPGPGPR